MPQFYIGDGKTVTVTTTWEKVVDQQLGRTFLKIVNSGSDTLNLAFGGGGAADAAYAANGSWTPNASWPLASGAVYEPVNVPPDDIWMQVASSTGTATFWTAP